MGMLFGALTFGGSTAATGDVAVDYQPSGTPVSSVAQFLAMDAKGTYYLTSDLDFGDKEYSKYVYDKSFRGVLDGNGHSLLGVNVSAKNSDAGIFANNFGGTLKNITIGSEDAPAKISSTGASYSVGGIAGTFADGATVNISNVRIYAQVKGGGKTAGMTSYMRSGTINIDNCEVYGTVSGNPASGYICMSQDDGPTTINIKNSLNFSAVTASFLGAGGFYAAQSDVLGTRVCHLTISGCANHGAIKASDWRVGGLVGEFSESKTSSLYVDHCYNTGVVTMTGSGGFAAGLIGGMALDAPSGHRMLLYSYNIGTVINDVNSRAYALAYSNSSSNIVTAENCAYISGVATQGVKVTSVNKASGAVEMFGIVSAYPESEDGVKFVADLNNSNGGYPILSWQVTSHDNVKEYECGRQVCLDCGLILTSKENERHVFNETPTAPTGYADGIITRVCKYCGARELTIGEHSVWHLEPEEGVYVISTPEQFLWYASDLEHGLLTGTENLIINADLDFTGLEFTPLGTVTPYCGTINGNCHVLSGIVCSAQNAALIAKAGYGATVINISIEDSSFVGTVNAGAIIGETVRGSIVRLTDVSVCGCKINAGESAGGVVGNSTNAANFKVKNCSTDTCEINGKYSAGIVGMGDSAVLINCYVNSKVSGTNIGTLAYYTGQVTATNCGYVKGEKTGKTAGSAVSASKFSSGEIAYKINSYGNTKRFGVVDGKTVVCTDYMKMLRVGSAMIYTDKVLSFGDGISAYRNGDTLVFVVLKNADTRLVDADIRLGGKKIPFGNLTLSRYVTADGDYYTAADGAVLYTLEDGGNSALTVNGSEINVGGFGG